MIEAGTLLTDKLGGSPGKLRVMCEPTEGFVMARRINYTPVVIRVAEIGPRYAVFVRKAAV